jgi:hypothetical protein
VAAEASVARPAALQRWLEGAAVRTPWYSEVRLDGAHVHGSSCLKQIASSPASRSREHTPYPVRSVASSTARRAGVALEVAKAEWLRSSMSAWASQGQWIKVRAQHRGMCALRPGLRASVRSLLCPSRSRTCRDLWLSLHSLPCMSWKGGNLHRRSQHSQRQSLLNHPARRHQVPDVVSRALRRQMLRGTHSGLPTRTQPTTKARIVCAAAISSSRPASSEA